MDSSDSESDQFYECDDNVNLGDGVAESLHLETETKANSLLDIPDSIRNNNQECIELKGEGNGHISPNNNNQDAIMEITKEGIDSETTHHSPKEESNKNIRNTPSPKDPINSTSTITRDIQITFPTKMSTSEKVIESKPVTSEMKNEPEEENLWAEDDNWDIDDLQTPSMEIESVENEENLWNDDENWDMDGTITEKELDVALQNAFPAVTKKETSWGAWGSWLQTAASITTTVSQGLTNVIGVPEPEELAKEHIKQQQSTIQEGDELPVNQSQQPLNTPEVTTPFGLGISNFVSGVSTITKLVETTGSKVISGGLGTLETIGKKTYEVLQENDPQLKKKRAFLKQLEGKKPVLSQILREAKERAEEENKERERTQIARKANYETMFDDYEGLVHLEALEMLSKECDIKLQKILRETDNVDEAKETMEQVKDLCELTSEDDDDEESIGDEDELRGRIEIASKDLNIPVKFDKLLHTFDTVRKWITSSKSSQSNELHAHAIEHLAQITALAVEQYHKAGEYLLIKKRRSTADEADNLVQLTTSLTGLISVLSTQYTDTLKNLDNSSEEDIKNCISNIFLEAANSSRYIEDAFKLLIPVIQVGAM